MNQSETGPNLPTISGKWLIIGVALLAIGGASFAWWYRLEQTDEALFFWGPDISDLLVSGQAKVEMLQLEPMAEAGDTPPPAQGEGLPATLAVDGRLYAVKARVPGDQIKGLVHFRNALIQDASFNFADPPAKDSAPWTYAMQISFGETTALILFDPETHRVGLPDGKTATLQGEIAQNLGGFLEEVFGETPADEAPSPEAAPESTEPDSQ